MTDAVSLDQRIAVIGASGRFPKCEDLEVFWRNLAAGFDGISRFTEQELRAAGVPPELAAHQDYVPAKGVLEAADRFDAALFGLSPREAETLDPQHRVFLEAAWAALEDAAYDASTYRGNAGVFAGADFASYLLFNLQPVAGNDVRYDAHQLMFANDKDYLATRIAYKLDLRGPAVTVQTACSTSLVAIHMACQSLLNGECDLALAGGVSVSAPLASGYLYQEGGIASPDGRCRPFDARAQGTLGGNGVGVVVLKRLEEALADGDAVRGVVLGSAVNNDGGVKVGYTAPSVEGQARVISEALALSEVEPADIAYVETHGTATPLGDPIEIEALARARRDASGGAPPAGSCALGAVKANIGHLGAAAGVAGFLKALLAVERAQIPPTPNFEEANPRIDLKGGGFHVNTELTDWPEGLGRRRAAVSSFGIGGTNAHAVLEEAPPLPPSGPSRPWQILPLSARTGDALERLAGRLADHLEGGTEDPLADVAHTLQVGRRPLAARRFVLARDLEEAVRGLRGEGRAVSEASAAVGESRPSVVFLFPGQGVLQPSTGRELYRSEPVFRRHFDECAAVVKRELGVDLTDALSDSEAVRARLDGNLVAQPALFAFEYALAQVWGEWGVRPEAVLGHSLGELVAAVVAGVFERDEALSLVCTRGRLMASMPSGAMVAVPRPADEVEARLPPDLEIAAINAPDLCTVSGPAVAVERFEKVLRGDGVPTRRLSTDRAFHSAAVDGSLAPFAEAVVAGTSPKPPRIPLISNRTGRVTSAEEATDPEHWARQMREPVRFADGLGALFTEGERLFLEIGPGRTLSSLVGRHPGAGASRAVASLPSRRGASEDLELLGALGRMWLAGAEVDWQGFAAPEERRRLHLPTYPFERRRCWVDPPARQASAPASLPGRVQTRIAREAFLSGVEGADADPAWVVLADGGTLARKLAATLGSAGRGRAVECRLDQAPAAALEDLRNDGARSSAVTVVGLIPPGGDSGRHLAAFAEAAEALAMRSQDGGAAQLVLVASSVFPVGEEELPPVSAAAIGGLWRSLTRRHPGLCVRLIELDVAGVPSEAEPVASLVRELCRGTEPWVAYRGRRRWSVEPWPAAVAEGGGGFTPGAVYAVVGALEGAGWAMAQHVSGALESTVVALEADGLPPREEWPRRESEGGDPARRIGRARALGPKFRCLPCDWTRAADLSRTLDRLEEDVGSLAGVLVAPALEPADLTSGRGPAGLLASLDRARRGLGALERALVGRSCGFCVLHPPVHESGRGGLEREALAVLMEAAATRSTSAATPWVCLSLDGAPASGGAGGNVTLAEAFAALEGALAAGGPPRLVLASGAQPGDRADGSEPAREDAGTAYEPPRNELEEKLAAIWQELLGVERVGIRDDFYALGGHSLLATQVVARIKEDLPVELPMLEIFRSVQTVEELAGAIEELLIRELEALPEQEAEDLL